MKRKMSENSLKNLKKGKPFTAGCKEVARKAQEKSVEKRKENKAFQEVAKEMLNKQVAGITFQEFSMDKLMKYVQSEDAKPEIVIKILELFRDSSGQKPTDKQQIEASGFSVVINNKAKDVKRD